MLERLLAGAVGSPPADSAEWLVEARSYSHPVTNATLLAPLQLGREFKAILNSALPHWLIPSYLHEATHHWCHMSTYGLATALLFFRTERAALKLVLDGNTLDEVTLNQMVQDWHRFSALAELLRPIGEGLALFVEFDDLIGDAPTVTDVMEGLKTLAHAHPGQGKQSVYDHLNNQLLDMRLLGRTLERLTDLYVQPMTADRGGYLLGYLAVRELWRGAATRCERLLDRDLFVAYMRSWFFDDPVLPYLVLNPAVNAGAAVESAGTYFGQLLGRFQSADHEANLDDLVATQLAGVREIAPQALSEPVRFPGPDFNRDPDYVARGRDLIASLYRELDALADTKSELGQRAKNQLWALAQRDLMCIGKSGAELEFRPGRVLMNLSGTLLAGPSHTKRQAGTAVGSVEVYQSLAAKHIVVLARADDEIVLSMIPDELPEAYRDQMLHYRASLDARNEWHGMTADIIRDLVRGHLEGDADAGAAFARALITEPLEDLVLAGVTAPGLRDGVIARLREGGFHALLGKVSRVRALAWLDLRKSLRTPDLAASFDGDRDRHRVADDLRTVTDDILEASVATMGWPLLLYADNQIQWGY